MSDSQVSITDHSRARTIEVPVLESTMGPNAMDIRNLYKEFGYFSYDLGFLSTASCESTITYVDGDQGVLMYRGYNVADLARSASFIEVCYLLLKGELPTADQLTEFEGNLIRRSMIDEGLKRFFAGFHHNAHPMAMMVGVVGSLSAFYHGRTDLNSAADRELTAFRLIAKMPTIAAAAYKHSIGEPFVYPRPDLSFSANLLNMMFDSPVRPYEVNPVAERALDMLYILHADHEQNASTSTVRMAGSSGANPYACIAAGIAALWGPAHGGANEEVVKMLAEIGSVEKIQTYIDRAKDKDDPFRLMGFGHRVYKNHDPRAVIIRETCHELLCELGAENQPQFELALRLEEIALEDPYFIERKLYPNVDFYSGLIYKALGIPTNMFTVMFAIARTVGWLAHWSEMLETPGQRIARPRQVYRGHSSRAFVAMDQR